VLNTYTNYIDRKMIKVNNNIFHFRKSDASAYLLFYIVLPVTITYLSLKVLSVDISSSVYCYVTILVSTLNNLYDAANRWDYGIKTVRNSKIIFMYVFDIIVAIYCVYVIMSILIVKNLDCREDWLLYAYIVTCIIALWDIVATFARETTLTKAISNGNGGE
jgi:hypothetical protein